MLYLKASSRCAARLAGLRATGYGLEVGDPVARPGAHSGHSLQPTPPSLALVALALCTFSAGASAANWEFAPRIAGGYKYNDNYRLDLPGNELEVSGMEADARVTMRTLDPRTTVEITPRVRATYFPDEKEEDSTDYFLRGLLEDVTPRQRIGVRADLSREDVVRSELPDPDFDGGLGDPESVDGGRIVQRNERDLIRLSPYYRYDLTQRTRLELDAHYLDVNFKREFQNAQQDFSDYGVRGGLAFQVSPRSTVSTRLFASRFETTFETEAYGAELQWTTDISPTSQFYVMVGGQQNDPELGDSQSTIIGGIGGRWDSPRNSLFLDLTRSVGPVSAGTVVERHQLRVRVDHDVSERLALLLGLRASRDEDLDEPATYPTRDYASAEAGLEWRWQRFLALRATYNYYWQDYEDEPSDASANGFLISLVYEPKRRD